jgi:hypothetical protein
MLVFQTRLVFDPRKGEIAEVVYPIQHFLEHIGGSSGPEAANAGKRREGHAAVNSSREMT